MDDAKKAVECGVDGVDLVIGNLQLPARVQPHIAHSNKVRPNVNASTLAIETGKSLIDLVLMLNRQQRMRIIGKVIHSQCNFFS